MKLNKRFVAEMSAISFMYHGKRRAKASPKGAKGLVTITPFIQLRNP